jgi:hypothetical protein
MTPLFVLTFALLVVLASFTSDDQYFCEIVTLCRPPPLQDWGRARTAGSRFARMKKSRAPPGGNNCPENGLVNPQPSRHVRRKGAVPLSGAEEQTESEISAHAQCAFLLSLQMGSINKTRLGRVIEKKNGAWTYKKHQGLSYSYVAVF